MTGQPAPLKSIVIVGGGLVGMTLALAAATILASPHMHQHDLEILLFLPATAEKAKP